MAKRTPAREAKAKQMRADGHSDRTIAAELSKGGETVTEGAIRNWLGPRSATAKVDPPATAPLVATPKAPPTVVHDDEDDGEMSPEEFGRWLSLQLRQAQTDAQMCRADDDQAGAARAMKLAAQLASLLAKAHARAKDDGDTVPVKVSEMTSAAERTRSKFHDLVARLSSGA